jgi:hypothetical protein
VLVSLGPSINSQQKLIKTNKYQTIFSQPDLNGLLDIEYLTYGVHIHYGNIDEENVSGELYIIDNISIDPNNIWLGWIINPNYVDNTYGNGTIGNYPAGKHTFNHLKTSDHQEIRLFDSDSNLVFYAKMDLIHKDDNEPSGYGTPEWGEGDSEVIFGDSSLVTYTTSTVFDVNYYYNTPPYDVLEDSPTLDDNYLLYPGYENWEHKLIYEIKIDRSLFGSNTLSISDIELINLHASPNKIGDDTYPLEPCDASLGDYVWHDEDKDGIQDPDESGFEDITVELYTCDDTFEDSTVTDINGYYIFYDLEPNEYYVKFILPSSYGFTSNDVGNDDTIDSDADPNTGETICTDLLEGEIDFNWDAGICQKATVGDCVWEDLNGDGIQDFNAKGSNEYGIDDVEVELYTCDDTYIDSTITSGGGYYEFSDIDPGSYYLKFITPPNFNFTLQDQGTDDTIDSDADPTTGKTICIDLETGEYDNTWAAGMYQKASIGDYVWEDSDGDGIQDIDEIGVEDVMVGLYSSDNGFIESTQTSNDGYYQFLDIVPGSYYVKFILPSGYIFTLQDQGQDDTVDSDVDPISGETICTELESGENDISWDAGLFHEASIGNYVWKDIDGNGIQDPDELGVDDVTVELYKCDDTYIDSTITSGGGYYEFSDIDSGSYYLKFIPPTNYMLTLQDQGTDDTIDSDPDPTTGKTTCTELEPGENDNTWDAGIYEQLFSLDIAVEPFCGWVEKNPDLEEYPFGTEVQLTAHPNISAFEFSHWSGDLSGSNNPEYITMENDKSVTAHFDYVEFTLTINIDGEGYVIKDPDQPTYHFNDFVELTAVADPGWTFSYWSGDLSGSENPERIQMYGDKVVTAHFTYNEYVVNINTDGDGVVIKKPDQNTFPDGSSVELTANGNPGWKFSHWSGDITGSNNPEDIQMDSDKTVTAHFVIADSPEKPIINGPTNIKINTEYTYNFKSTDPQDKNVWYYVDWGDGNVEDWFGPYPSGKIVRLSHSWSVNEPIEIKVKAKNIYESESEWGTLNVLFPRFKTFETTFLIKILEQHSFLYLLLKILFN